MKFKALTTCFAGGGTGHYTQQGRLSPDEKNTENQVINLHPELSWEVFEGFGGRSDRCSDICVFSDE